MGKALDQVNTEARADVAGKLDWRKRMSDHVAYALLVYTGVQIGVTMALVKGSHGSILPYFALVALVAAIIPACRLFEGRWTDLPDEAATDPALAPAFTRECVALWVAALGLPFVLAGLFNGIEALLG